MTTLGGLAAQDRTWGLTLRAALVALALGWTSSLHAEHAVAVHVEGAGDAEIQSAVERELAAITPAPAGVMTVRHEGDDATIVFVATDGRRIERSIRVQHDTAAAAEEIALVAASLARDDASWIIGEPEPTAPIDPPPAPTESAPQAPPPVNPTPTSSAPKVVEPAVAPVVAPPPHARSTSHPTKRDVDPCTVKTKLLPVSVDLAPYVGMSSSADVRDSTHAFALNLVGGLARGLRGLELGGVANLVTGSACGVQLGGAVNVAGRTTGLQMAGAVNVAGGELRGLQLSLGVNVAAADVTGAQVGGVNVAAGRVRGVQIGAVNVSEKSDLSLGVVNIAYKGRFHVDVWSNLEVGMLVAAVKNGGDHWHSIYGVGTRVTEPGFIGLLGFGGHARFSERFYLDVDLVAHITSSFDGGRNGAPLVQLRPVFGVNLIGPLALYAGAGFNALVSTGADGDFSPDYAVDVGPIAHLWPGAVFGVQAIAE